MMSLRDAQRIQRRADKRFEKAIKKEIAFWESGEPNIPASVLNKTDVLERKAEQAQKQLEDVLFSMNYRKSVL